MTGFKNMVDMTRSDAEKAEERLENMYPPVLSEMPDIPPGLCICLTEVELEKLGIETEDCDVGDMIHVSGMCKLTSKNIMDTGAGVRMRFEMGFVFMAAEDEEAEVSGEDKD